MTPAAASLPPPTSLDTSSSTLDNCAVAPLPPSPQQARCDAEQQEQQQHTAQLQTKKEQKQQHKLQQRTATSLAFLDQIERVVVTGTTYRDEREQVLFRVVMKDEHERAAQMSRWKTYRDAKRVRPVVSYDNTKALSTLKSVHATARKWSSAHTDEAAATRDNSSNGRDNKAPLHCAYCNQFLSPAALQEWQWNEARVVETQQPSAGPALTVVVNNSSSRTTGTNASTNNAVLRKIEQCLNSYLAYARRTELALSSDDAQTRSECQGCQHIPTLVASFLQNEDYSSVPTNVVLFACQVM